jgi:hypothetical protein
MKFSFTKKVEGPAAELAALKSQLENARRRITDLTLENIQQANEISVLQDYRGVPPEAARRMRKLGREIAFHATAANSETDVLFNAAVA